MADFEGDVAWDADDVTNKLERKLFAKLSPEKLKTKKKSPKLNKLSVSNNVKKEKKENQDANLKKSEQKKKKFPQSASDKVELDSILEAKIKKLTKLKERRSGDGTLTKQQKKKLKRRLRFTQKKLSGELKPLVKNAQSPKAKKQNTNETETLESSTTEKTKKRKRSKGETADVPLPKKTKITNTKTEKNSNANDEDKKKKKSTQNEPASQGGEEAQNKNKITPQKKNRNKYKHLSGIDKQDYEELMLARSTKPSEMTRSPFNLKRLQNIMNSSCDEKIKVCKKEIKNVISVEKTKDKKSTPKSKKVKDETVTVDVKASSLKGKMQERLKAARFRFLNEQMYTCTGAEALQLFEGDHESFKVYHEGFSAQVSKWPLNPVDRMLKFIKARPKSQIVADFGCGDAKLARNLKNKVHSFDLVALHPCVTACNMTKVPLGSGSVDIAVFCLSLMGTDLSEFLLEAHRVLKHGGTLLIAEVVSRIVKLGALIRKLQKLGFTVKDKDTSNTMFVWLELEKSGNPTPGHVPQIELLPCIYKKR